MRDDRREFRADLDTMTSAEFRGRIRRLLARHPAAVAAGVSVTDAVQVAYELFSNALRHGSPPRVCRVVLTEDPCLRIEVDDASPSSPRFRDADDTGGLGMLLVDRMSSSWGVLRRGDRKTVWAELTGAGASGRCAH